jgi:CRISPR system Cascade subunit CasE
VPRGVVISDRHLTRACIKLARPPAQERGVTLEYIVHQSIADLFGDRSDRGYVWRLLARTPDSAEALLLSSTAPDPAAGGRMPPHRRVASLITKPFRPELQAGQRLDFEIRVNATRVVTTPGAPPDLMDVLPPAPRKQRHDVWDVVFAGAPDESVCMADVYSAWLRSQLGEAAEVGEVAVTERGMLRVRRSIGRPAIPVIATNLVGDLTVRDPDALVARMAAGIGRSRAFGCGLLCLARLGSRPRRPPSLGGAIATRVLGVVPPAGV